MPIWQWISPYGEEIQINPEIEQIQETLNQFKQLMPDGFAELGQPKKYWGSTEGLDKSLCERYTFKHDNKSYTLDIAQELSNKLELNSKNNFCVKEEILSRLPEEGGITINNKEEIFIRKSFIIESLEKDIDKLFKKIESLEQESNEQLTQKDNEITELNRRIEKLEDEKEKLKDKLDIEKGWWDKWIEDERNTILNSELSSLLKERKDKNTDFYFALRWHCGFESIYFESLGGVEKHLGISKEEEIKNVKTFFKIVSEYYKNQ